MPCPSDEAMKKQDQMRIDYDKRVGAIPCDRPVSGRTQGSPLQLTDVEVQVLFLIQRGRENAISMSALAGAVGISTRELQDVIKHLIEDHGVLIASATGKNHGYYYPVTEDELISARAQIIHRIQSLARRLRAIDREAFEEIFGQGRMEL